MTSRILPALLLAVLLWSSALLPALAQPTPPDSVAVFVDAPAKTPLYLMVVDPLDNSSANFLGKGTNQIEANTVVRDSDGKTDVFYLIDGPRNLRFVRDETKKFWLLKSGNDQRDRELNFHVAWRKAVAPIQPSAAFGSDGVWQINDLASREKRANTLHQANLKFLHDYTARYALSPRFVQLWTWAFQYDRLRMLIMSNPKKRAPADTRKLILLASEFSNDSALHIPHYQRAAYWFSEIVANGTTANPTLTQRYDATMTNFKGRTRDFMLTKLIVMGIEGESLIPTKAEFATCLNRYNTDCQTESYKAYIGKATSLQNVNVADGHLLTTTGQSVPFSTISANAPLTYVDFWASWCGPCREEMAASKALRADYEAKGIRFVYISLDANPGAWERAVNQIGLNAQTSYLLPGGKKSVLANRFKIGTVPHYMLIGKDGRVLSATAPRPGTPAIRQLIQNSLN